MLSLRLEKVLCLFELVLIMTLASVYCDYAPTWKMRLHKRQGTTTAPYGAYVTFYTLTSSGAWQQLTYYVPSASSSAPSSTSTAALASGPVPSPVAAPASSSASVPAPAPSPSPVASTPTSSSSPSLSTASPPSPSPSPSLIPSSFSPSPSAALTFTSTAPATDSVAPTPSTSSSSAPSPTPTSGIPQATIDAILQAHNSDRAQVGESNLPIAWNSSLAVFAQTFTDKCVYMENPNLPTNTGENIGYGTNYPALGIYQLWSNEKQQYQYGQPYAENTGHYTQIIWNTTSSVGCGLTSCSFGTFLVCDYFPQGNILGQNPY